MRTLKLLTVLLTQALVVVSSSNAATISYTNTTGGTVYEMDTPSGWSIVGAPNTILPGAGPNGADAYYRPGATGGIDDATQAYWDFGWANLPNVGHDLD